MRNTMVDHKGESIFFSYKPMEKEDWSTRSLNSAKQTASPLPNITGKSVYFSIRSCHF